MNKISTLSIDLKKLIRGSFVQNVAKMLAGNLSAQAVALLAAPVITRLYTPHQFGIMTFIQAFAGICIVIACFQYRNAILLPDNEREGQGLIGLSLFAAAFTSFILLLVVIFFKGIFAELFNIKHYENFLFFLPPIVLLGTTNDILICFHTRLKNFSQISFATVLMPLSTAGTKISAGVLISASAFWLVFGNMMGYFLSVFFLLFFLRKILPDIQKNISIELIKRVASKYAHFPKYNVPAAFINSFNDHIPVLLFSAFFSHHIVGLYGLANMVLQRPINVMAESISKVFFQKSAEVENKGGNVYIDLKKTTIGLILIGIFPFGLLAVTGKWLFVFIFGAKWAEAGYYAQILSPYLFFLFINKAASQIYFVKDGLRVLFLIRVSHLILICFSFLIGIAMYDSPIVCLYGFMVSGVIINVIYIQAAFKLSKNSRKAFVS